MGGVTAVHGAYNLLLPDLDRDAADTARRHCKQRLLGVASDDDLQRCVSFPPAFHNFTASDCGAPAKAFDGLVQQWQHHWVQQPDCECSAVALFPLLAAVGDSDPDTFDGLTRLTTACPLAIRERALGPLAPIAAAEVLRA